MRMLRRLRQRRKFVRPGPIGSIRFITCLRCMGHGYFWTDPPDDRLVVAFGTMFAAAYANCLLETKRISCNQHAALQHQIALSDLPFETPPAVQAVMSRCFGLEEKLVELASIDQSVPDSFRLVGMDVAEAVHEFLLTSPEHSHLRTQ